MRSIKFSFVLLALTFFNCSNPSSDYAAALNSETRDDQQMYVIERMIPGAGSLSPDELKAISLSSCDVIEQIGEEKISWLHSYVTADKVYCVYLAKDTEYIREHAQKGGFPANSINAVGTVIGPGTAE